MLLNVPFVPDEQYAGFLKERSAHFYSYHFSLYSPEVHDARYRFKQLDTPKLIDYLKTLGKPKKYLLINNRVHHPGKYRDTKAVLAKLDAMLAAGVLDGIVYADAYYLQALSDAGRDIAAQLEAVPSVNFMIDDFEKITALMDAISMTAFRMPGKLSLDRSLNRRMESLSDVVSRCRESFPDLKLELLANEGCLYQCPFKLAHDSHISLVHMDMDVDTHSTNRSFGCIRYLAEKPEALFKSPFIRPEDVGAYKAHTDILKVCGRTLGRRFLERVVTAYLEKSYGGNLLDLMDAMDRLSERLYVDNAGLPDDFFKVLTVCSKRCDACPHCRRFFKHHVEGQPLQFKDIPQ
jgi:collagenase-like PrtC family protease